MQIGYGLTSRRQASEIAERVVEVLGGGENAYNLLMETAMQETKLGTYRDRTNYSAGTGLCQSDRMPFKDTQERISNSHKKLIFEAFDIDVDRVEWRELEHSPLLAFLWCRMHYLLRKGAIPSDVIGRAKYWKTWYNSVLGKGTIKEYVYNADNIENTGLQCH